MENWGFKSKLVMGNNNQSRKNSNLCEKSEVNQEEDFPATCIQIGAWQRKAKHEGDLVVKLHYARHSLAWEVLERSLMSKMEIYWSDICAIRAITPADEPGILEIELVQPPMFYRETGHLPHKQSIWLRTPDFTGGQAPIWRRHQVTFPPGILEKIYGKLLQCNEYLNALSTKPFPRHESPFFDPTLFALNFNESRANKVARETPNPSSSVLDLPFTYEAGGKYNFEAQNQASSQQSLSIPRDNFGLHGTLGISPTTTNLTSSIYDPPCASTTNVNNVYGPSFSPSSNINNVYDPSFPSTTINNNVYNPSFPPSPNVNNVYDLPFPSTSNVNSVYDHSFPSATIINNVYDPLFTPIYDPLFTPITNVNNVYGPSFPSSTNVNNIYDPLYHDPNAIGPLPGIETNILDNVQLNDTIDNALLDTVLSSLSEPMGTINNISESSNQPHTAFHAIIQDQGSNNYDLNGMMDPIHWLAAQGSNNSTTANISQGANDNQFHGPNDNIMQGSNDYMFHSQNGNRYVSRYK